MMTTKPHTKLKKLFIHTSQGYSGELSRESQFVFGYRTESPACAIGLTVPLQAQTFSSNILPGPLRQNIPEGFLLNWMKEKFGKALKMDDFNLLAMTGSNIIGRVSCSLEAKSSDTTPSPENLKELLTWKGTEDLFQYLANKYASSSGISGVQPKVLISANPENEVVEKSFIKDRNLIVKTSGFEYQDLAENEFHCMSIAKKAGLVVPRFWLSDNRELFIIERFDIDPTTQSYLGFEDMTSLTGKQNDEKYESSYEVLAKAIDTYTSLHLRQDSKLRLFESIVLSAAVRNGDAHLKNFGLLYTSPITDDVRLSPIYDIVNTTSYIKKDVPALKMNKVKAWPTREDLVEFGKRHCSLDRPEITIDHILEATNSYQPEFEPGEIWQTMSKEIDRAIFSLSATSSRANKLCP